MPCPQFWDSIQQPLKVYQEFRHKYGRQNAYASCYVLSLWSLALNVVISLLSNGLTLALIVVPGGLARTGLGLACFCPGFSMLN